MAFMSNAQLPSLPLQKPEQLTVEAERDHYRRHNSNMVLIIKELQEQLARYKQKCAGVDTFAVLLKEAKQESDILARQKKALETAIANLQNRLSTNGLSASVNIEETDVYEPGTSKQTLDNLARENARLRSLLKGTEYHSGKKPSEDLQKMKALVENLESGKNQLQAQLQEVQGIKMSMVQQYEEKIASLKEEMVAERLKLQKEVEKYKLEESDQPKNSDKNLDRNKVYIEKWSVGSQTPGMKADVVNNLKQSLKDLTEQCRHLDNELENLHLKGLEDKSNVAVAEEKASVFSDQAYQEMQEKLQEVTLMNQRWQVHNDTRERQHMSSLSELKNEVDAWKQEAEGNRAEKMRLIQVVENLKQNLHQRTFIDPSMVEILKQQIQVCTEDFNNERKDHEQAIQRGKSLQTELDSLKTEHANVKQELDGLKQRLTSQQTSSQQMVPRMPQAGPQTWWPGAFHQMQQQKDTTGDSFPDIPMLPPAKYLHTSSAGMMVTEPPSSTAYQPMAHSSFKHECEGGPSSMYNPGDKTAHYMSQSQSDLHYGQGRGNPTMPPQALASMPVLNRRCSDIDALKNQGAMACPKCNKEFPEDESRELIQHIDDCKD